jgi:hypothetical protein
VPALTLFPKLYCFLNSVIGEQIRARHGSNFRAIVRNNTPASYPYAVRAVYAVYAVRDLQLEVVGRKGYRLQACSKGSSRTYYQEDLQSGLGTGLRLAQGEGGLQIRT